MRYIARVNSRIPRKEANYTQYRASLDVAMFAQLRPLAIDAKGLLLYWPYNWCVQ